MIRYHNTLIFISLIFYNENIFYREPSDPVPRSILIVLR